MHENQARVLEETCRKSIRCFREQTKNFVSDSASRHKASQQVRPEARRLRRVASRLLEAFGD